MPKCLICNNYESKSLQSHLKYTHNISVQDYKDQYSAEVYDYNPGNNFTNWAKANPEKHLASCSKGGTKSVSKMNAYLDSHPEVRHKIAVAGGKACIDIVNIIINQINIMLRKNFLVDGK